MKQYDAIVVGAGVVGAAVARELSRRKGSFLVVERARKFFVIRTKKHSQSLVDWRAFLENSTENFGVIRRLSREA